MESYDVVQPCKCKSQFCERCTMGHCVRWREALRPVLAKWKSPMMLTLTCSGGKFSSPREAYEYVGKKRKISELVRYLHRNNWLHSKEFVYVIEFHQKKAHQGWPHYHLQVDSNFVPKHLMQKNWGLGVTWFTQVKFADSRHAVNYITKYITKTSEDENEEFWFPDWVLDYPGNFRRFSTSHGLIKRKKKRRSTGDGTRSRIMRTGRQRAELCWQTTNVWNVREHVKPDGELLMSKRCIGTLREPWSKVCNEPVHELKRRLDVQKWNDKQMLLEPIFGGLDPVVYQARRQWRKLLRESRRGPTMRRQLRHCPAQPRKLDRSN